MKNNHRKTYMLIGIAFIIAIELIAVFSSVNNFSTFAINVLNTLGNLLIALFVMILLAIIIFATLGSLYYAVRRFMDVAYGYNSLINKNGRGKQPEIDNFVKGIAGLLIPAFMLWIAATIDIPIMMADGYQLGIVGAVYFVVTIFAIKESLDTYRDPKKLMFLEKFEKGYYHDRIFN